MIVSIVCAGAVTRDRTRDGGGSGRASPDWSVRRVQWLQHCSTAAPDTLSAAGEAPAAAVVTQGNDLQRVGRVLQQPGSY